LQRLFQPFYRVRDNPHVHGLGLGLFIASEIAKAHGGTLRVTSTKAETRFVFEIPQQMPAEQSILLVANPR
jgi:signal transduction histidine kinase